MRLEFSRFSCRSAYIVELSASRPSSCINIWINNKFILCI